MPEHRDIIDAAYEALWNQWEANGQIDRVCVEAVIATLEGHAVIDGEVVRLEGLEWWLNGDRKWRLRCDVIVPLDSEEAPDA